MSLAAWLTAGRTRRASSACADTPSADTPELTDVARWRTDFPALHQTLDGLPLSYLDSAATTQRPGVMLAALQDYYLYANTNPGSTLHTLARRTKEYYEDARTRLADFIHASHPDEVVWVRGTTEGINLLYFARGVRPRTIGLTTTFR